MRDFWMTTTRLPDGVGSGGGGEGDGETATLDSIRQSLGIADNEELDLSEFTDEERTELLKGSGGDDDEGEGEGQEAGGANEGTDSGDGKQPDKKDQGADDSRPEPAGYVKLAALHEARQENRELRQRLDKITADQSAFQQKLVERLAEVRAGKKPGEQLDEPPDENKDPVGAIAWLKKQNQDLIDRINGKEQKETEAVESQQKEQQYQQYVINTADEILTTVVKEDPTLQDAFTFAQQAVIQELQSKGYRGRELEAAYQRVLVGYAESAPNEPKAFAEYVRRNARYWGWDGKPLPKEGQKQPDGKKTNGGGEQLTPAQKLALLKKGTERSKSLQGGGHGTGGELNVDDLAEMSGEEIEKLAETNPELFEAAARRE